MSEKESSKRIRLTVEGGPTREFPGDRTFVIGRSQNADFSIPHPNLSREHVRFSLKDGEVWLEDLGSANGTFVQGQRIPPKSSVKLKSHYRVLLGTGSNVVLSFEVVEGYEPLPAPEPKGDVDLPTARERTLAAITRNQQARDSGESTKRHATGFIPAGSQPLVSLEKSNPITKDKTSSKMELDFPQQHFPHEVKKEKMAELRILEAKKQRVLEDIQYKEREVDDLRGKIRTMREESLKLKEQTENFKRDLSEQSLQLRSVIEPLQVKKDDLEKCVQELDLIYEEKIDSLETGFRDLKATLEESHSVRMARADKEFKEKTRRLDEEYANKLTGLENEINSVRSEGERLRDQLVNEKRELEENLRKVRAEAERLEADRKLEQVRIDTEIAKLQGAKLKIENDIEAVRREHAKVQSDAARLVEQGKAARAAREEARGQVEEAKKELEALRQTISDVKRSEAKNLERIDELKSHITTLERNAESISGLIRKAEADAESVRRQAKDEAESLRRSVKEESEALRQRVKDEVENYRRQAQEAAENERQTIRRNAEAQALAQIQTAEAQAFARTQASESEALARIQTAEAQANARTHSSEQQAQQRIGSAEAQATARLEKAQEDARTILERAHTEGNAYFETKKRDADEIFATAQARAHELEHGSKNHAERALAEANASLEARRKTLEAEIAELRRRTDQEIRQVRANALADIEGAKDREAKEFINRLRTRAKSIGDQIERVVGSKLTAQFGVTMDPVSMKAFSDEIHQIVETVIGPTKGSGPVTSTSAGEKTLSTIMPVDSHAQERAVKYWKRVGVAAAIFAAIGIARIAAPGAFSWLGTKVGSALEVKDNTDAVVKRMLRERQLAMTVVTEQDQRIRDSYTDNILYTEGFIEMKEDIETQKVWTLGLNKFFQSELGLTEKAIVQFGSAEGRMVRDLVEQRKNLVPTTKDAGIAKMRETEAGYVKEIKFTFRTDSNWQKYLAYQRDFYQKYLQSLSNRAPANAGEPK